MKLLKHPAIHMLIIGGMVFGGTALSGRAFLESRPQIVIPQHRLDLNVKDFVNINFRPPTTQEYDKILNDLIDEEILYNYALILGMHEHPVIQRRLTQIAQFVEANPDEGVSQADAVMKMGLHHGDLIIRRILIDSAKRLIRAVILSRDPQTQFIEEYYASVKEEYIRPALSQISHVMVDGFKWPDTHARALELLRRIQTEDMDVETAVGLGNKSYNSSHLPLLDQRSLEQKFGYDFAVEISKIPERVWSEPISSRYGHHLVYVHERSKPYVPSLDEVHDKVKTRALHKLANEWLALRLKELRLEFDIVMPERKS